MGEDRPYDMGLLRRITGTSRPMPPGWVPDAIHSALPLAAIVTPLRVAHFLAQTCWESAFWTAYEEPDFVARLHPYGIQWKGRGAIQTTWEPNYVRLAGWAGVQDLHDHPELVATPEWAFKSSVGYWDLNGLNRFADADDGVGLSKAINGVGCTTLAQRSLLTSSAKKVLGLDP
jgi:putative chitinase